jgi:phosphodiesterase/alkaline phosphatase D-like protein
MSFLVIPNEVYANDATIWVAAINENLDPATTVLEYGSNQKQLNGGWLDFATADGKNQIRYQRVPLNNLSPRQTYSLGLRVGDELKADGSITTIPYRLPVAGERPFTILLGSCYFGREDKTGAVGQTYMQLPAEARPDVKFLCGDQVYLDNPFWDFLNPLNGRDWLQARSFKTYADTWTQTTLAGGFGQMLKHNANFFTSDDHEYWNNAPDVGLNVLLFTMRKEGRKDWWDIARELYQIFQTTPDWPVKFKVEPLSFCIAETRFNRGSGGSDFMLAAAFDDIGNWAANLEGPGVIVVGQPFFDNTGSIKDYGLPDFTDQYNRLKQYLRRSNHTIVILTGDVHYGRLAGADLRPELGTKLYEVISSPMQLVPGAPGKFQAAPQVFGSVTSQPDFSLGRNHFLTLEFTAPSAQRASMLVRFWPIIKNGMPLQSQIIGKGPIELV